VSSPSDYVLLYHSGGGGAATATVTSSVNHALTASNTHIVPKWLYAASTSVQIFDTQNSYTLLPATIAQAPNGMAFDLSGHLFMAVGNTVLELDTNNSNATVATLAGLSTPEGVAYDASTGYLYVANFANGANSVSVFNASSGALYTTISGANTGLSKPAGVAVSSNHHLYVANNTANTVTEYDLTQITATSWNPTPLRTYSTNVNGPIGVAVLPAASPNPGILFVANNGAGTITSYNTSTAAFIATLTPPGSKPYNLFLDTSNDYLYIALNGSKQIAVYQINSAGTSFTTVSNTPLSTVGAATSAVVQ
jgi:DNA-binding beta-propeller fold protein YncE